MKKRAAEIFNNKVGLIYEYNKSSPLFVRMAAMELDSGNIPAALNILNEGMRIYPDYAVPYFVIGKCYSAEGNYSEALKAYKKGSDLIYSTSTYDFYLKEVESLQKQKSIFQYGISRSFLADEEIENTRQENLFENQTLTEEIQVENSKIEEPNQQEPILQEPEVDAPVIQPPSFERKVTPPRDPDEDHPYKDLEERLEEIARGISSVRLNEVPPSEVPESEISEVFPDDAMIVSETLAKIYAAQGEILEAIQVYKKLVKKNPSKEEYYNEKINELRSQLE